MFSRAHHQRISQVLHVLDGEKLKENCCYFGGGTAIALRYGEYRESVDIDFLVSDIAGYRNLRQLLMGSGGMAALTRPGVMVPELDKELRADQYGIRTYLRAGDKSIKFEIVFEGRITLDSPALEDRLCGITTLSPLDMATSKLLANSDRWADDGVFSRDVIDLAMMRASARLLQAAKTKAETAYGATVSRDLLTAISKLQDREGWLERCMGMMGMSLPRAVVWQQLRRLRRTFL